MKEVGKLNIFKPRSSKKIASRIIFFGLILTVLIISTICVIKAIKCVGKPFAGFLMNQRMVVGNAGQYYWTGVKAGIKFPDRILKADGRAIFSLKDLEEVINSKNTREGITYSIERNGKIIEVAIPTMLFAWSDLLILFGLPFLSGIIYLLLGAIVYIMKPETKVSWAFLFVCLFLSIYTITAVDDTSLNIVRINLLVNTVIPAALIYLGLVFPEKRRFIEHYPSLQFTPYIISFLLAIPILVTYPHSDFLPLYRFVFIYVVISAIIIVVLILYSYLKKASIIARQRAKVVLFGASLAFPFPALAMLMAFFGITFFGLKILNNFLTIPLLIFPASIAYAIAKHNLFDVDVYIKRAVGYGIMVALIVLMEFSTHILSEKVLSHLFGEYAEKVFPIFFVLLIVLTFNPVYHKVREFVEKLFYRKKFDYKGTVLSVSNALCSVLNLDEIIKRIIHTVRKEMFIDTAGVVLLEPQSNCCRTVFIGDKPGDIEESIKDVCIPCDDPLFDLISREKKLITRYDIEEDPHYASLKESCGQRFSEIGASMVMPLIYQNEVKGALALGYKKSGHFYTREDIDLLETLTNNGAIAIENARLAEQMEKEVEVRTDLARYLSPQVVEQVIKKDMRVDLAGHKKVVTVLISDIRNFIKITETYSPEQLVHILNEYFTEMSKIIFENQGSLDKYIGDAIVAVFGSLIPLENSGQSAARAAIQMMKCMPSLNKRWVLQYGLKMDIGIGINTGEVFLGNVGSPERMEFTVIGDTVNVASRLSDLAQAGQILIARNTFACLGSDIPYRELPTVIVKGKKEKQEVFEILYS